MFSFFKEKSRDHEFYAPSSGKLTKITEIEDPVFSSRMLGDGYGIEPDEGTIYSPVYGTITTIFPTKHAIGIRTKANDEVLVHIGIDTVELQGKPFEMFVKKGDKVTPKTKIAAVDLEMLKELNKPSTIIVVYTNRPSIEAFDELSTKTVVMGEKLGVLNKFPAK